MHGRGGKTALAIAVAIDPVCKDKSPSAPDRLSVRGDPWTVPGGVLLRAAVKQSASLAAP